MSFSILSYPYYKDVYTNEAEAKLGSSSRNVTGNVCSEYMPPAQINDSGMGNTTSVRVGR